MAVLGVAVGAAVGAMVGGVLGRPGLGAAVGGVVALGATASRRTHAPVPTPAAGVLPADETGDVVGFLPGGYGELIGGPGPWTPERMLLGSQYKPDQYGWAMYPATQSAYGPILSKGGPYGPAYLEMPADSTLPGSSTPGQGYFQQDVQMRAAEAARVLGAKLRSTGFRVQGRARTILNAVGIRFEASGGKLELARKTAGEIARVANLAAVLVRRGEGQYAVYYTDYPALVLQASDARGEETDRIAGLDQPRAVGALRRSSGAAAGAWDQLTPDPGRTFEHYAFAGLSGAAAGAGLGALSKSVGSTAGAVLGTAAGLAVGALTRETQISSHPTETEPEAIGREAVDRAMAGQTGRWLSVGLWGPLMVLGGMKAKTPLGKAVIVGTGAVIVGTTVREIVAARDLRLRYETAALRKRIAAMGG